MRKLEISPVNSKGSNKIVNKTNMKTILQVWKAQRKTLLLDQDAKTYAFKNEGYLSR